MLRQKHYGSETSILFPRAASRKVESSPIEQDTHEADINMCVKSSRMQMFVEELYVLTEMLSFLSICWKPKAIIDASYLNSSIDQDTRVSN